ncbi:MAG: hypothetical protein HC819_17755 [Cyclobacteriaceae bacterium]|nr:hypothetical protein [Cyclobacteriaceae bacterium]
MKEKKTQNFWECCMVHKCEKPGCDNYEARRDLIQKIIDGQANPEEQKMYSEVIEHCLNCKCREYCEQELAIKNLLQTKLDRKRVPLDILEKIKSEISKPI